MSSYDPAEYGDSCARFYDQLYPNIESGLLDALTGLARGGPVLELGLATGRVARRLNEADITVYGIEASRSMIERCRSLPGADGLRIVEADFAAIPLAGRFRLVFALVNTLSLLPSRELLKSCLDGVAKLLGRDGLFLYETYMADHADAAVTYEYAIQTSDGVQNYRVTSLTTAPGIFDDIAVSAGLRRVDIWEDWQRTPVSADSKRRIMIYGSAMADSALQT